MESKLILRGADVPTCRDRLSRSALDRVDRRAIFTKYLQTNSWSVRRRAEARSAEFLFTASDEEAHEREKPLTVLGCTVWIA